MDHQVAQKRSKPLPYNPNDTMPLKVWYSRPTSRSLSLWYLRSLASGSCVVNHFGKSAEYAALLGCDKDNAVSKRPLPLVHIDEDDLDPGETMRQLTGAATKRRRRAHKKSKVEPLARTPTPGRSYAPHYLQCCFQTTQNHPAPRTKQDQP